MEVKLAGLIGGVKSTLDIKYEISVDRYLISNMVVDVGHSKGCYISEKVAGRVVYVIW